MKKCYLSVIFFFIFLFFAFAQQEYNFRTYITEPIYSAKEKKNKQKNANIHISDKNFKNLGLKEKFNYIISSPNLYKDSINVNAEEISGKIFNYFIFPEKIDIWTEKQRNFLRSRKNEIIPIIKEIALKDKHLGLNLKMVIWKIDGKEIIPFLVDFYQTIDNQDKDILTLLMLLMKDIGYYPFIKSNIYRELYIADKAENSFIEANNQNENYILKVSQIFHMKTKNLK